MESFRGSKGGEVVTPNLSFLLASNQALEQETPKVPRHSALILLVTVLMLASLEVSKAMASPPQKSITKDEATQIARKLITDLKPGTELVILEDKTVEKEFGWVFFYTTKKYIETKDRKYLLPGNAPLVVNRKDGSTRFLSSSAPPARAIEEYEKTWRNGSNSK